MKAGITGRTSTPSTIAFGEEVLREAGIPEQAPYTLFASDQFDLTPCRSAGRDRLCQFSVQPPHAEFHLHCPAAAADRASSDWCSLCHVLRVEPGRPWLKPHPRNKWGRQFETYPHQDPYHYPTFP